MKSLRLAFFGILVILFGSAQAQDYAFKVLVNKGKNELKTGSSWQQVKVGSSLKTADEIKVSENAYLGLVHVSGKAVELKQSGNYKVEDLAKKVSGGSDVLNKYTDFILSSASSPKNRLAATGAVDRGTENIQVYLPKADGVIYNNNVIIEWDTEGATGPYVVSFKSMFDDELDKRQTDGNSVAIDLSAPNFANEDNILVEVTAAGGTKKISVVTR
jgi:hypothetical protein